MTLRDGTVLPREQGDILKAMDEQAACIKALEDHIRVKGLGSHPRAKPSIWFLECYNLKLSHRMMELIWKDMQAEGGANSGIPNAEPIHPPGLTAPCPPEQRVHPVLDATASVTAATDTREGRFRMQKRQPPVRMHRMMADRTETGGAGPKGRPTFTPGPLAPMVSSLRERGQRSVRGEAGTGGPPSVTPTLPTANPFRPLVETPDDWEMAADTEASPANPPAPAATGVNLTTPPAPDADAKRYKHVDIAYALITNRLNTQAVPADAIAMQFGEAISEREEVPDMADVLTAVCLAYDRETGKPDETGPWMVAAPQRAIEIGAKMGTFTIWLQDANADFSIKPCDGNARLLVTTRSTYAPRGTQELNVTVVLNLPRWCLGRSLKLGHLDFVKDTLNDALGTFAPGIKTNITQAETAELGMTKGSLFLFFYPRNVEEYRIVKTALRAFKRFPIVLGDKAVEPVRAYIAKDALESLNLRKCCHRPPEECDQEKAEDGITQDFNCRWVKRCDEQMGFEEQTRRGVATTRPEVSPVEQRKRNREGTNRAKEANRASMQVQRIQGIKSLLCTKFAAGEVRAPPVCSILRDTHLTHTQPGAVRPAVGGAAIRVPTPPLRESDMDATAHRVPVSTRGPLLLRSGGLPVREARDHIGAPAVVDATLASPARPGDDRVETRGEGRERIQMQTGSRADGRDRERETQQDRAAEGEREGVRMRGVWDPGELDERIQASIRQRRDRHRARGCVYIAGMLHGRRQAIQGAASRCAPDGTPGGPGSRLAHAGAQAAGHGRHEDTYSRRTAGTQDCQPRLPGAPQNDDRDRGERDRGEERTADAGRLASKRLIPYCWHTTNILWIRGRLPWIIPGRHA